MGDIRGREPWYIVQAPDGPALIIGARHARDCVLAGMPLVRVMATETMTLSKIDAYDAEVPSDTSTNSQESK